MEVTWYGRFYWRESVTDLKETKQRNVHVLQLLDLSLIDLSAFTLAQAARRIPENDKSDHLTQSPAMTLHFNEKKKPVFIMSYDSTH